MDPAVTIATMPTDPDIDPDHDYDRVPFDARAWIDGLGPDLAVQAGLLHRLLDAVEADPRWEWLELCCSIATGRGDRWSDLDVGLGFVDDAGAPFTDEVTALLRSLGPTVEVSVQPWDTRVRWWVQYADGGQIDLVIVPATQRPGRAPDTVALLDRQGRLRRTFLPSIWRAEEDEPRRWLLDGWEALGNLAKYVERDSAFEALAQLQRARDQALKLWAVGEGVPYPSFGLVSLLDAPGAPVPPDLAATYALADGDSIRAAAMETAELLRRAGEHAVPGLDTPLRDYVVARLVRS